MAQGVIYILTNPSFPEYVKIGYAAKLEERLRQLNRSEAIPYAFRAYATYEVESNLTDVVFHDLIDRLNPDLRSIETFAGRERKREFYAMSPEDAYSLLECIAKISGTEARLKKLTPEGHETLDEEMANMQIFLFLMIYLWQMKIWETIYFLQTVLLDYQNRTDISEQMNFSGMEKRMKNLNLCRL